MHTPHKHNNRSWHRFFFLAIHRSFFPAFFPWNPSAAFNPPQPPGYFRVKTHLFPKSHRLFLVSGCVYANLIYGCWRDSLRRMCITLAVSSTPGWGSELWVIFAGNSRGVTAPSSQWGSFRRHQSSSWFPGFPPICAEPTRTNPLAERCAVFKAITTHNNKNQKTSFTLQDSDQSCLDNYSHILTRHIRKHYILWG